ncbi:NUDIX domain-containing protein [Amycolatopsis keratiniphila]|uniref:NUDIX domain-containing protein n=1 Tax=Amycolatopsis keratiniphila TaxID=129921 RepID=UPI0033EBB7C4
MLCVLLVERKNEPFRGRMALPGGFLRGDESTARELAEATGHDARALKLQQVGVYSAPDRDEGGNLRLPSYRPEPAGAGRRVRRTSRPLVAGCRSH